VKHFVFDLVALIRTHSERWIRTLLILAAIIGLASFSAAAIDFPGNRIVERLSGLTSVRSLATWLTAIVLLGIGLMALLAAFLDAARKNVWNLLAIASVLLSAEEVVGLHEMGEVSAALPTDRPPSLAWLLAAVAIAALILAALTPFLRSLPRATAVRFVVAGSLISAGTIGLQFLGELVEIARGTGSIEHIAIHNLEELSELVGMIVLLGAVTRHIGSS
jgi:hypothetical protein